MSLFSLFKTDLKCYADKKWPDRNKEKLNIFQSLYLLLRYRGLYILIFHRFRYSVYYSHTQRNRALTLILKILCSMGGYLMAISTKTILGPYTMIDSGVYLSNGAHMVIGAEHISKGSIIQKDVTIGMNIQSTEKPNFGENVWIGANSLISGGITVGQGAVISEGTVLTKSIPAHCIVSGNPARVIARNYDNTEMLANPEKHSSDFLTSL